MKPGDRAIYTGTAFGLAEREVIILSVHPRYCRFQLPAPPSEKNYVYVAPHKRLRPVGDLFGAHSK